MQAGTHRIRRQRWQVKVTSTATAFTLRQALRTQFDAVLLPAFERAFDALNSGDEVWHIPRLTLDLQLRDGDDLIAALAKLIEQELAKAVPQTMVADPSPESTRRLTPKANRRQLLLDYLSSGRIAWHAARQQTPDLLSLLRDEAHACAAGPQTAIRALGESLESRMASSFRLLQLLDPLPRAALLKQVPDDGSGAAPLRATLSRLIAAPQLDSGLRLWLTALLLALRAEDLHLPLSATVVSLLRECATQLAQTGIIAVEIRVALTALREQSEWVQSEMGGLPRTEPLSSPLAPLGRGAGGEGQLLPSLPRESPLTPNPSPQGGEGNKKDEHLAPHRLTNRVTRIGAAANADRIQMTDAPTQTFATTEREKLVQVMQAAATLSGNKQLAETADGYLANDAGLILLHPFLPRLFHHVGITSEGTRRLDPAQMPRAAALLHWLATGREEAFEFELSLIKVLLGLVPRDPLPVAGELLKDDDRAEADALLAAAIEHWTALRSTSLAGLRSSFLQRRGLLYDGEQGWRLQVETEAFDMLLGQLPWGINVVKLPWMTRPIFTDWPTP
jgi:contractile injection system tape measure protein